MTDLGNEVDEITDPEVLRVALEMACEDGWADAAGALAHYLAKAQRALAPFMGDIL